MIRKRYKARNIPLSFKLSKIKKKILKILREKVSPPIKFVSNVEY